MRNLLVLILAVIVLSACSKSAGSSTSSASFLSCAINGTMDTFPVCNITSNQQGTPYFLVAQDKKNNGFSICIVNAPLSVGTTTYSGSANSLPLGESTFNGIYYIRVSPATSNVGSSTIAITSLHNGYADGTFSATYYTYSATPGNAPLYITKGVFRNVPIAP